MRLLINHSYSYSLTPLTGYNAYIFSDLVLWLHVAWPFATVMAHRKTLKPTGSSNSCHAAQAEPRSIRLGIGAAHVPAICIAVCLNCVNRPKLRISFGFNLKNLLRQAAKQHQHQQQHLLSLLPAR